MFVDYAKRKMKPTLDDLQNAFLSSLFFLRAPASLELELE